MKLHFYMNLGITPCAVIGYEKLTLPQCGLKNSENVVLAHKLVKIVISHPLLFST